MTGGRPAGRRPMRRRSRLRWMVTGGVAACWVVLEVVTGSAVSATVVLVANEGDDEAAAQALRGHLDVSGPVAPAEADTVHGSACATPGSTTQTIAATTPRHASDPAVGLGASTLADSDRRDPRTRFALRVRTWS